MNRIPSAVFIGGAIVLGVIALALLVSLTPRLTSRSQSPSTNPGLQPQTEGVIKGTDSYNYPGGSTYTPPVRPAPGGGTMMPAPQDPGMVACTMDAMQCPDGTYVGRVAPNCQFAPCPGN